MEHYHCFLQYAVVAFIALATITTTQSDGRELRPSDHGLVYQDDSSPPPTNNEEQQMMSSFFGTTTSSSSSSSSSSPAVELPEAKNISQSWWTTHPDNEGTRGRDLQRDHVRVGLLVASAVCGLTGVVLLSVSGIVFLYRLQKQKLQATKAEKNSTTAAATAASATATSSVGQHHAVNVGDDK